MSVKEHEVLYSVITTRFVEVERGVCCPSIKNLQLIRVKDISYSARCCCNCCGCILIISEDKDTPELHICGIPNGRKVFASLRDAVTAVQSNAKLEIDV